MNHHRRSSLAILLTLVLALPFGTLEWSAFAAPAPKRKSASKKKKSASADPVASGSTLEQRIDSLLNNAVVRSANVSIQIVDVETGTVVAERDPHNMVAPASNMKLFTTGAALDNLKPSFEITTPVEMRGTVDQTGTLHGDVRIVGHGDPTISGRLHDGNATAVPEQWADALKAAGVRTIAGNLIFEYGYFDTEFVHPTWPTDQLVNWYEAPVSAFSMQEGCVAVRVYPTRKGERARVELEPENTFLTVQNTCTTGGGPGVFISRKIGTNDIIVRGNAPPKYGPTEIFVAIQDPIRYFANVVHQTFLRNGINVQGQVLVTPHDGRADWKEITRQTTPLPVVVYVINKVSQNHYAEQLLKILGAERRGQGSWDSGSQVVHQWLVQDVGVPANEFHQVDGSGMSRDNRVTANAFIHLLRYMWNTPYRREFVSSMPYSGEPESRLRHRLNQAPYARQVYAKTGYISGVIGLSGYVHAKSGRIYAFSFLFNHYRTGVWGVYRLQDKILEEIVDRG